jgi:hypothetical protein
MTLYEGHYISYRRPCVEEGTPEARKRGCLCQSRDDASAEERKHPDWVLRRIHETARCTRSSPPGRWTASSSPRATGKIDAWFIHSFQPRITRR